MRTDGRGGILRVGRGAARDWKEEQSQGQGRRRRQYSHEEQRYQLRSREHHRSPPIPRCPAVSLPRRVTAASFQPELHLKTWHSHHSLEHGEEVLALKVLAHALPATEVGGRDDRWTAHQ